MSAIFCWLVSASRPVKLPQNTPTRDAPFKRVRLIGSNHDPIKLIKLSDIFILTSVYEGLPNVLLEAQVLKTYIISSNCPTGPREILLNGKAGSLFKVGDYNSLI